MPRRVLILGGRGNGTVVAAALDDAAKRGADAWVCAGFLNDRHAPGETIDGHPVLGPVAMARDLVDEGYHVINTILRIDGQRARLDMFDRLGLPASRLATFVHPAAYVAPTAQLGAGVVVMPNASVSPGATLGAGCLVMVGAVVGHDARCGRACHVAALACVGSRANVGVGVHIGMNATVGGNLNVGDLSALGMGAVLTRDMGEGEIWVGNPARFLRMASPT